MTTTNASATGAVDVQDISARLRVFATPDDRRALWELAVTMVPFWPWIHANPIARPIEALLRFTTFSEGPSAALFNGAMIPVTELPRSYGVVHLAMRLPEWLIVIGCAAVPIAMLRRRTVALGMLALAAAFPIAWVAATRAPLYDGLRQLAFSTADPCERR